MLNDYNFMGNPNYNPTPNIFEVNLRSVLDLHIWTVMDLIRFDIGQIYIYFMWIFRVSGYIFES